MFFWRKSRSAASQLARQLLAGTGLVLVVSSLACGRAGSQGQGNGERKAAPPAVALSNAQPSPLAPVPAPAQKLSMAVCPSKNFSGFLKVFANRLDVQDAFTLRPIKVKSPYYWKHNTEPGDPRYPKWITQESKVVMPSINYRYDELSKKYVWDDKELKVGEVWSIQDGDRGKRRVSPLPYFKVRRVSSARYEVDYIRSGTDSYVMKAGCWHLEEQWEREEIVNCKWPDECRRLREYEAEPTED
ncbi:hypothetical protein [Lysobacter sp. CA199]|uniref:hypothetical protein n=1 Tax=Lysobacter sp. CA199 TaxID=3455608 RepID=UPI003F8CF29A